VAGGIAGSDDGRAVDGEGGWADFARADNLLKPPSIAHLPCALTRLTTYLSATTLCQQAPAFYSALKTPTFFYSVAACFASATAHCTYRLLLELVAILAYQDGA